MGIISYHRILDLIREQRFSQDLVEVSLQERISYYLELDPGVDLFELQQNKKHIKL